MQQGRRQSRSSWVLRRHGKSWQDLKADAMYLVEITSEWNDFSSQLYKWFLLVAQRHRMVEVC